MPVASSSVEMNVFVFAVDAGGFSANSGEAIRNMALAGHGSARLAIIMVGPDITAGRLIELLPDWPNPKRIWPMPYFPAAVLSRQASGHSLIFWSRNHTGPAVESRLATLLLY